MDGSGLTHSLHHQRFAFARLQPRGSHRAGSGFHSTRRQYELGSIAEHPAYVSQLHLRITPPHNVPSLALDNRVVVAAAALPSCVVRSPSRPSPGRFKLTFYSVDGIPQRCFGLQRCCTSSPRLAKRWPAARRLVPGRSPSIFTELTCDKCYKKHSYFLLRFTLPPESFRPRLRHHFSRNGTWPAAPRPPLYGPGTPLPPTSSQTLHGSGTYTFEKLNETTSTVSRRTSKTPSLQGQNKADEIGPSVLTYCSGPFAC